jgi:hypothetical protein
MLKFDMQEMPVLWALIDTDEPLEEVVLHGYATGEPLPSDILGYFYRGTTNYNGFITHWFEAGLD